MLDAPFAFEIGLTGVEYERLGRLAVRWSHIEHVIGNCLRQMLKLSLADAGVIVYPMSTEQRLQNIAKLVKLHPLDPEGSEALSELTTVMKGLQVVRNDVLHGIIDDELGSSAKGFTNRAKNRKISLDEVFGCEELTNYAAHAALSLRYALGVPGAPSDQRHPLPDRPEIPTFLRESIPTRKK